MKKVVVIIAALISFLSFSTFSFAQGVMTNTEINNPKPMDDSKPVKKVRKANGAKHRKGNHPKPKRLKPARKKPEGPATPGKTNP